ncbi:MAG: hypothetical protein IT440_01545, partial [Phycisphaeraceae bacterium]|nr:hypothetical protein [Phycisphaeraceae bacterium]
MNTSSLQHPPVDPVTQRAAWQAIQAKIAASSLAHCTDFPRIAQRYEAWWAHEALDRPILVAQVNGVPSRPINRRLDLLMGDPRAWLDAKKQDMINTHRVGDALPSVRVDFGPVLLGAMFGGKTEFGADTSWTHNFIDDDWSNAPDWQLQDDNPWWKKLRELTELTAKDAAGNYLVCTPDLGGSGDVILNLRGSTETCMDMADRPELIEQHVNAIYPGWRKVWSSLYSDATKHGAGVIHWLTMWSTKPYMIPACDLNFMLGPEAFNRHLLPDIARQAETAGRAVFHLDGPGAAKHFEALLDVPEIEAIQFTPGEGTPSALAWLDMFRRIQQRGRSLFIITPAA